MNKIRVALIATAILLAVGGAFATRPCVQCEVYTQYVPDGTVYGGWRDVGEYGVDYLCDWGGTICTYYVPDWTHPNNHVGCRLGTYAPQ